MKYNLDFFLDLEKQILEKELFEHYSFCISNMENQQIKHISRLFKTIHTELVNSLINYYMKECCNNYKTSLFSELFEGELIEEIVIPSDIDVDCIPRFCEGLHVSYLNSELCYSNGKLIRRKSKKNLLALGAVYTQDKIAYDIVKRTLCNLSVKQPKTIKILDFATGTGRFYRQIVRCLNEIHRIPPDYSILHNIFAVDIDSVAINICRINALSELTNINYEQAKNVSNHIILKNALIKNQLFDDKMAISIDDWNGMFYNGFDAIVSNPPYLVLKPNKNKMDAETVDNINSMAMFFRNSNEYKYSIEGMLNLYQLSIEAMLGMLKNGGEMGIICPSTLFADISASTLRKHLLSAHNVTYIKYFSEEDPLFDNVTQATCIFHLTKGGKCNIIDIVQGRREYQIELADVKQIFSTNWEIPSIEKIEWNILRKLCTIPALKTCSYIRNKRGELDLTLFKDYITLEPTSLRLVRGNMIIGASIVDINHEYVKPEFFDKKSHDYLSNDKGRKRLVCQQISNMTQRVRIRFVECENNDVLGNSCNYITVKHDKIHQLKTLLNSAILNWRFKITSTNNHINNYELDELPIIDLELISSDIIELDEISRNKKICTLYGLESEEVNFIIKQQYDIV